MATNVVAASYCACGNLFALSKPAKGPRVVSEKTVVKHLKRESKTLQSVHSCLSTNQLAQAFSIVQSGGIQHAPRQVVRQVVRRPRPSWVCMAEDGDGNAQKVKEKKKEDYSVASYLKALEDLKKAEDAVERLKNHAADTNQQLPKSENVQQDLNSAKETAQKAEIQQKSGGELSQKDLDTLHAAIDQAYKSAKEQGLIKDPLDLQKLRRAFDFTTFDVNDSVRYGSGGIFPGILKKPLAEVRPSLEKKLQEAAGTDVYVWYNYAAGDEQTVIVVVQRKEDVDQLLEAGSLNKPLGWGLVLFLAVATISSVGSLGLSFLPQSVVESQADILARLGPIMLALGIIVGVSETSTRLVAKKHGVKLGPTVFIPSGWTGCLGLVNSFESVLPDRNAFFDVSAIRAGSALVASLGLAAVALYGDKGATGGPHPLYITPGFFVNNPLVSFIQYVIGPYSDELGNVLPHAVEGLGVPVNPLAFGGLLGVVVSSIDLLPSGRLSGGRIAQALFGRQIARRISFTTNLLLGLGGLSGSVLCLAVGFIALFFRGGEELPAKDEITPVAPWRYAVGLSLFAILVVTLFPNSAGTFPSTFYIPPYLERILNPDI